MTRYSYVAMLLFCLAGTLPLVRLYRLQVFQRPVRLVAAIIVTAAPFVVWDLWATHAGHWSFDRGQTLGWRVAGLPLEEYGFFVVIPLAAILAYETVRAMRARSADSGRSLEEVP
ncbi:lycopene cyclase domain-containing protein [Kribbella albertanoniae]|uniref:Lycopene cyclase domain-containing protein n=1 Tax=Kribbella albertanoniae TaxID=1266829 RepID=A0A4R4PCF0_9ACTN|nr:lycopene cyclase domain-containing protein [Kribbella albertanoniae]